VCITDEVCHFLSIYIDIMVLSESDLEVAFTIVVQSLYKQGYRFIETDDQVIIKRVF